MIEKIYSVLSLALLIVITLFVYFLKRKIDFRLRRQDDRICQVREILLAAKRARYDTLIKTVYEVWEQLKELEFTIRYKMPERVEQAQQNGEQFLEFDKTIPNQTLLFIEKRSIFLTEELNQQINYVLKNYLFKAYNGYIYVLNEAINGRKTLDVVNSFIPTILGGEYQEQLATLEKMLAEQARKILYNNQIARK